MRLTLARKLWIGFGILMLVIVITDFVTLSLIKSLEDKLEEITAISEPSSAAAYEMEINVIGTGMGVMKYLETGDPQGRARVKKDEADFERFKAVYDRLAEGPRAKQLGTRIGLLYGEYKALGDTLMNKRDEQQAIFAAVGRSFEKLDEIIDERIQAGLISGSEKVIQAAHIETDIAEVGTWLGNYLRLPKAEYKERVFDNTRDLQEELAQFKNLRLTNAERRSVGELEKLFGENTLLINEVFFLNDYLQENVRKFLHLRSELDNLLDEEIQILTSKQMDAAKRNVLKAIAIVLMMNVVMLFACLTVGGGTAAILVRSINKPIRNLMEGASKVGSGALDYRVETTTNDEIGDLTSAFNRMAEKRRQAAERLRLLESAVHQAGEAIVITLAELDSPGPQIVFVNPAFTRMTGYTVEEAVGRTPRMLQGPKTDRAVLDHLRRNLSQGRRFHGETINYRKDGTAYDLEWHISPIRKESGEITHFVSIQRDISERKRAEEEIKELNRDLDRRVAERTAQLEAANNLLRHSENRFNSFMNNSPAVAFMKDEEGRYVYGNQTMERLFQVKMDELLGKTDFDWLPKDTAKQIRETDMGVLATGQVSELHEVVPAPSGSCDWLTFKFPVEDATGRRLLGGVAIDITERTRAEEERRILKEQLLQAQKMEAIGRLAGGVAHDFNNLLAVIIGYSDLTLRQLTSDDPSRRRIEEIRKAADRAAALTSQLLTFSRRQVTTPEILNLNTVVSDLYQMLSRLIGEDIELQTILDGELGHVKADRGQIEQVILNLAVNARDAMPQGGKLMIETANVEMDEASTPERFETVPPGRYVVLTVSDTGCGMDAQTQARIFEPFFTTKQKHKGTGLGLSTVHGIANQSDGHVVVHSEVGHGTMFEIYLPLVNIGIEKPTINAAHGEWFEGSETILLVEDEDVVRRMAREVLEAGGYRVLEAVNHEALKICELNREPIHLLLTDVIMPQMSGPELAKQVSRLRPEVKVLYMSGYTDDMIGQHGMLEDGVMFLQKPFTPDALARKVREALNTPGKRSRETG